MTNIPLNNFHHTNIIKYAFRGAHYATDKIVKMMTLPLGTGKYTAHRPHHVALGSHYAALGPQPNGLQPLGGIMGHSSSIMFGPRAVYFPISFRQGHHIIPIFGY